MEKINLNEIPNKPGVYIFKDDYDEPIYVGKAKNLKNRVSNKLCTEQYFTEANGIYGRQVLNVNIHSWTYA